MTRARLTQLRDALESDGWDIASEYENGDLFSPEEERIVWALSSRDTASARTLVFYLSDHLGRRTQRLADLSHVETQTGTHFYFSRINSEQWQRTVDDIISALQQH
ncbi:hypothetical protein [Lysobacter sp. Root690]|uniref:hypothetical protein n=1 Tax=Lysobacter sp. Root690 TaxID=1736588 RepID=UPI0006F6FBA1|nr:hypothetical protein [Lysobacter sp. Root690]KRB04365.1 hypothetical protein ASD86_18805 [Lysobacter sp. Root690]